ncbi:SusC/RagA family TonB-linked outer membrane protein [Microbacter margulisiae]|uniref:TonB-linked SusC/RagA family outer membrane protein n=1 Tax=Microbacter margulisiae TaxID=1350067 RepID=A0A7W5DPB9_9PORP|nr:TonB-dependent receptor [Microbacter margulisiae]MBB3186614.1 TonB-linked SusC/RagA family outer membrane protein [Microbacter margulisiae]
MRKKVWYMLLLLSFVSLQLAAQSVRVTGTVRDAENNSTLPGVSVMVKGSSQGVPTDLNGRFEISVPKGSMLQFSYIGYVRQEHIVNAGETLNINLQPETTKMNEVVVIGYGTSKAKDLTAPIAVVKPETLLQRTTASPMDALQGSVAGVQVTTNGAPGSSPSVRIRGVGSLNNEGPLYVVDGMFFNNIDFLNSSDIQSMSILKDASAAAIYGVRAANGVVIITTKSGVPDMPTKITYSGYAGFQTPSNMLKMANGAEYATMELAKGFTSDAAHVTLSSQKFGGSGNNPTTSTDWYGQLLRTSAFTQNHAINISGGGEKTTYSAGINYLYQDGIMNTKNYYDRLNINAQTDYQAFPWLKIGYNVVVSNATLFSPNQAAFAYAYAASPLYPVYDPNNTLATPIDYASSTSIGYGNGEYSNPVAAAHYYYNKTNLLQVLPTVFAQFNLWGDKLVFKTQYSQSLALNRNVTEIPQYYVDAYQLNPTVAQLTKEQDFYSNYILDNTLTYKDQYGKNHLSVLLGNSVRSESWQKLQGSGTLMGIPNMPEYFYLSSAGGLSTTDDGTQYNGLSFFTRAAYDYASRYLLTVTMRADGSSKYQQKWGYFPSIGAGWIMSDENFMKHQHLFDYLKARVSWGQLGNDAVPASNGFATIQSGNSYSGIFGSSASTNGSYVPGYVNTNFFSWLKWEVVNEWDGGLDFSMLKQRLNGTVDYYNRVTNNAVIYAPQPMGAPTLLGNFGEISNSGFEFSLNWKDKIGDFGYSIGANLSTLKNNVKNLHGLAYMMGGKAEFPTISEPGAPLNSFYGYKVVGVYQNAAQVAADPIAVANGLQPGDFKYADVNKDGILDSKDRVLLGSYLPTVTYGMNVGVSYKHLELNVMLQGQAGNKILNMNRANRLWYSDMNGDAKFVTHLWTGEGSTNSYPSALGTTKGWNNMASSFFVESGAYLRVQTIQLAYSFKLGNSMKAPSMRVSFTADRPIIFTKYSGFTPEIGYSQAYNWGSGYDTQTYPTASTYTIGWTITY